MMQSPKQVLSPPEEAERLPLRLGRISNLTWPSSFLNNATEQQWRRQQQRQQQRQEEGVATDTAAPIKEGYRRLLLLRGLSRCWLLVEAAATTSARWVVEAA